MNRRRVGLWRRGLAQMPQPLGPEVRRLFAYELLNAGEADQALRQIYGLLPLSGRGAYALTRESKPFFDLLAVP